MINIQKNIPLAPFTTFRIGGPAKFFCETKDEAELLEAVEFARSKDLEIFVLAGGSNILISDEGFKGLVIKLKTQNSKIKIETQNSKFFLECLAGEALGSLVNFAKDNSLLGLEWASGIPGSVGGAVRGNAGAYGGEIKDNVITVRALDLLDGFSGTKKEISKIEFKTFNRTECKFDYRSSLFKENKNLIIFSILFELRKGDQKEIEARMKEVFSKRREKVPTDCSAGSFFQNPIVENPELIKKFENDALCPCRGGKIPAGWIIEELGLRGKKMGGVAVSEKHANFVVNLGEGKAEDVLMLSSFIKQQARAKLGVQLREEVQLVGF